MSNDIAAQLKGLKLHGMASTWPELLAQSRHTEFNPERFMKQLLMAETAERQVRSIAYQMTAARFPAHRDLKGFDFAQAHVDEALVRELSELSFLASAHNVVFIGGPGTGKTHLASAIGIEAVQRHGKRVRYFSTVELTNALEQEKSIGKQGQIAHKLMYVDLVILDELGYAVQPDRRCIAVPSALKAIRAHERRDHDQSQLRRVGERVRGRKDDDGAAGPRHPSLPHRRNGQ